MTRDAPSVALPAGNGRIILMTRLGYDCAAAGSGSTATTANAATRCLSEITSVLRSYIRTNIVHMNDFNALAGACQASETDAGLTPLGRARQIGYQATASPSRISSGKR